MQSKSRTTINRYIKRAKVWVRESIFNIPLDTLGVTLKRSSESIFLVLLEIFTCQMTQPTKSSNITTTPPFQHTAIQKYHKVTSMCRNPLQLAHTLCCDATCCASSGHALLSCDHSCASLCVFLYCSSLICHHNCSPIVLYSPYRSLPCWRFYVIRGEK